MKYYTVSTKLFKSIREAKEQVALWQEDGSLNKSSMVFEVDSSKVWIPSMGLKKIAGVFLANVKVKLKKGKKGPNA